MPTKIQSRRKPTAKARVSLLSKFDQSWTRWNLKNGLRCIHVPLPSGDARFHLGLMVHTGSRWEPVPKAGLSHLLEHMMFRGSANYPTFSELSEAFENLGGEWNAATGHEYTEYYYSGTLDKAAEAFKILADFTLSPALNDLETERRIVLRELEGELNEYGVSTDVDFHILRTIWPKTTMASPIIGSEETLKAIQIDDLKNWLKNNYHAANMMLVVVGGSSKNAKAYSEKYFEAAPRQKNAAKVKNGMSALLPGFTGPSVEVVENSDNEYDVQLSFVCEGTNSPKTPIYDMISRLLGDGFSSRLVKRIREELGLVYDISTGFHQYDNGGAFNINANISDGNIETFFTELFGVLSKFIDEGPTPAELTRHCTRAVTDLMLIPSEPAHAAFRLAWSTLTDADPRLEYWRSCIEEVDKKAVQSIASELFRPVNLAVVALGPKDASIDQRFHDAVQSYRRR